MGPPGGLLASGSEDMTVRVWEVESSRLVWVLVGHTSGVCALAGLPGGLVASGLEDGAIVIWRVAGALDL